MKRNKFYRLAVLRLCLLLSCLSTQAQRPLTSTAEAPVWYYIQVLGDGDRTDRVMTEQPDGDVYGHALIDSNDETETAAQLWRVEADGYSYRFVNRQSGHYMNVRYDSDKAIGVAATTANAASFKISDAAVGNGRYFNIAAAKAPAGIDASETYLHQANNGGSRNYVIMMVGSNYSNSENSAFRFVEFEDNTLSYSDDENTRWYRITCAKTALSGLCLQQTDAVTAGTTDIPFCFALEKNDANEQEWKLLKNDNGTTAIVNRKTNRIIQPETIVNGLLNIVQSAVAETNASGWTLTYIGKGQYIIAGCESDGITRYLCATEADRQADTFVTTDNHQDTGFAFKLKLVSEMPTAIGTATFNPDDPLKVAVINGRICVEGQSRFNVHTMSGQRMNPSNRLPAGIYLVEAGGRIAKVSVR